MFKENTEISKSDKKVLIAEDNLRGQEGFQAISNLMTTASATIVDNPTAAIEFLRAQTEPIAGALLDYRLMDGTNCGPIVQEINDRREANLPVPKRVAVLTADPDTAVIELHNQQLIMNVDYQLLVKGRVGEVDVFCWAAGDIDELSVRF